MIGIASEATRRPYPRRPHTRRLAGVALALLAALLGSALLPLRASAHPLGNFTINRYARLEVAPETVNLFYVLDMAEIPTHRERTQMDSNGNGSVEPEEAQAYLDTLLPTLQSQLRLELDGTAPELSIVDKRIDFPAGQAGLPTMRVELLFAAVQPAGSTHNLIYQDTNYADRLGWQEVVVQGADGVTIASSTAPAEDVSQELRVYPNDLLQSPLTRNSAEITFEIAPGARNGTAAALGQAATNSGRAADPFAELVAIPELGPLSILVALLAAFGWGAVHALSPGHGKTIVAAYLVGARGTAKHAVFLGLTTTITHTIGVFVLGLITLLASQWIVPEQLYPWMSLISGLLVVGIGLSIGWQRWRGLFGWGGASHAAHGHSHADHSHADHSHADHSHAEQGDEAHAHDYEQWHIHAYDHTHDHSSGHGHSHLPPGGDGAPVTWRNLLALGISGGLLPCPSALVVMLGAIALGRVAFGLVLIIIFSLGLASVLTAIGILLVHAGKLFERIPERGWALRLVPVASAAFITIVGIGITVRALVQTGLLQVG